MTKTSRPHRSGEDPTVGEEDAVDAFAGLADDARRTGVWRFIYVGEIGIPLPPPPV